MNIEQAKKQAKNLRRLLPAYMAEHPDAGKLSDVQELIARTHGYPSFHAMVMAQERPAEPAPRPQLGSLLVSYHGVSEWAMFDSEGNPKRPVNVAYGELGTSAIAYSDEDILSQVTEEFDEACESEGGMTGDMEDYPASALNRLCRLAKKLTKKEPAFIDGYAFQAGAFIIRGQHDEARRLAEPIVEAIFEMIAQCATEQKKKRFFMPYYCLGNRPFHRLAHDLVLAYLGLKETDKALALCKQMLALWPNDNIGFRFIVADPYAED